MASGTPTGQGRPSGDWMAPWPPVVTWALPTQIAAMGNWLSYGTSEPTEPSYARVRVGLVGTTTTVNPLDPDPAGKYLQSPANNNRVNGVDPIPIWRW